MTSASHPVLGSFASASNTHGIPTSPLLERFPAPPKDVLSILRTFLDTQQRRVALWAEYDEAIEGHLKAVGRATQQNRGSSSSSRARPQFNGQVNAIADSSPRSPSPTDTADYHQHHHHLPQASSGHYDSTPLSLSDSDLLSRIISLVTSGLLDCAHETRAIALELNNPSVAGADGQPRATTEPSAANGHRTSTDDQVAASTSVACEPRPDLALAIGKIQDLENAVLRKIVRRDQLRRARVSSPVEEVNPSSLPGSTRQEEESREVVALNAEIDQLRRQDIAELMTELREEMADMQLGG